MHIRGLGAHNLESRTTRHTCFLVDGRLAIDAGSLASALTAEEHKQVRAVLLTHLHFDHTRDIPTLALSTLYDKEPIDVHGLKETLKSVHQRMIDGTIYPDFTKPLGPVPARYRFHDLHAGKAFRVLDYEVKAFAMVHPVPSVGFLVRTDSGQCFGYSGDTSGNLLALLKDPMAPSVLFVEMTYPNRMADLSKITGHLIPEPLRVQLAAARQARVPIPRIIAVHMGMSDHDEILRDLAAAAASLGVDITPGREDMLVEL